MTEGIHKPRPQDPEAAVSTCSVCLQQLRRLPAGQGYVHEDGYVVGHGTDPEDWVLTLRVLVTQPGVHQVTVWDDQLEVVGSPNDQDDLAGTIGGSFDPLDVKAVVGHMPVEDRRGLQPLDPMGPML